MFVERQSKLSQAAFLSKFYHRSAAGCRARGNLSRGSRVQIDARRWAANRAGQLNTQLY
jgi:hypothetical protein